LKSITSSFAAWVSLATIFALSGPAFAATLSTIYKFKGAPTDGQALNSQLIYQDGLLYGASPLGGPGKCRKKNFACGLLFSIDPTTGAEKVLYDFTKARFGKMVDGHLLYSNGHLYGTTLEGGAFGNGVVFDFNLTTSKLNVLHSFAGYPTDTSLPSGPLLLLNGSLYGTTRGSNNGSVYKLDLATGAEAILHSFTGGADGAVPMSGVVYENGLLYGTTIQGGGTGCIGSVGCGTIFSVDPTSGTETVVHSFGHGSDGTNPEVGLTDGNGILYGTTMYGPQQAGNAIVFSFDPVAQSEEVIYNSASFGFTGRLVYSNNVLYGTALSGSGDDAVAVSISLQDNKLVKILTYPNNYNQTFSDLVLVAHYFYGTVFGGSTYGLVFKLVP